MFGIVLIYLAIFLYEDEEGRIQYRLEVWDRTVAVRGKAAQSAVAAFMGGVAGLTGRFFDRLFGTGLLSFRFVGVSICYSVASASLAAGVMGPISHAINKHAVTPNSPLVVWFWALLFLGLGSIPALMDRPEKGFLWLWGMFLFLLFAYPITEAADFAWKKYGGSQALRLFLIVGLLLGLSLLFDLLFVVLIRWMLRQASDATNGWKIMGIILLNCVLAVIMLVAFPLFSLALAVVHGNPILIATMLLGFLLNFIDIAVCFMFFIVLVVILVHRLTWPMVHRPIHALARYKVITNKKLLWGLGCTLILAPAGAPLWKLLLEGH